MENISMVYGPPHDGTLPAVNDVVPKDLKLRLEIDPPSGGCRVGGWVDNDKFESVEVNGPAASIDLPPFVRPEITIDLLHGATNVKITHCVDRYRSFPITSSSVKSTDLKASLHRQATGSYCT
jgi:hypothetical protein